MSLEKSRTFEGAIYVPNVYNSNLIKLIIHKSQKELNFPIKFYFKKLQYLNSHDIIMLANFQNSKKPQEWKLCTDDNLYMEEQFIKMCTFMVNNKKLLFTQI